ncbi:MAG TPA: hypothetical protein VIR38_04865 [Thalassobaculum sp.]
MNMIQQPAAMPAVAKRAGRTLAEVAAEIERRVADAPVRSEPFPHLLIDDLLPGVVRDALDRHWPGRDRFRDSNLASRGELRISSLADSGEDRDRRFWSAMRALASRTSRATRIRLAHHVDGKFRPLLGPDWRQAMGDVDYDENDGMLAHYSGVVDLPAHVDNARLVVNGFVYLDDRNGTPPEPLRGTMLYRSIGFAWPTNRDIPQALRDLYLREAGEVEWRDNRLLAYINGPTSFHGVPRHHLGGRARRLLMFGSLLARSTAARVYDPAIR